MRILFMDSRTQPCTNAILALDRLGHSVARYMTEVEDIDGNEEEEEALAEFIKSSDVPLVMSVIFAADVARITHELGVRYAVWLMDSPAFTAWCPEADYDNCALFYFDRHECELRRQNGHSNAYHLPLAADVLWGEQLVITDEEIKRYGCDMSFVGGLYSTNIYDQIIDKLSEQEQSIFTDIIEQSAFVWDGRECLGITPELVQAVVQKAPEAFVGIFDMTVGYYLQSFILERKLTHVERTLLMELLAQRYDIHLYTWNKEKVPEGIKRFPEVDASADELKIHYASKINLNITLRSIVTGVPRRIFDVMSVGGFMLTNWQAEIPELFEDGKEIVTYKTPEELIDKADYYLRHETERLRIGVNGYKKVKSCYTYEHQLKKLLDMLQMN